ncbi:MAG TPA: HAMP domain-containing sensor histidine kinase [Lachnospiraceae bacterium]|nr:HAMP domain-containing sensor histidine kinase [Lachnospiraceae bacterium]HPF28935.1 HAMP domain-containing sensor histidine kinase [Lachnospiraceae bacterium]
MRKTLYLKFVIAYLIFAVFGFIVVATFMQEMTLEQLQKDKAEELYRAATMLAEEDAAALYSNNISIVSLKEEIDDMSSMLDSTIWIINPSGLIVISSAQPVNIYNPITIEGFDPTALAGSFYTVGDFHGVFSSKQLSVAAPITSGYSVKGYVIFHYDLALLQNNVNSFLNIDYLMLVILFLLSLIILIFFTEMVYLPLRKITVATEQYASGNLHYEFQVESEDEIGYLAASLSYMAKELARGEDNQKHIVANVSHDFRSPLTSIKGYLEAMQDGTIPAELYPKYVNTVLNETDRLIKLTNSLLTLNNLNTQGMILEKSDFDINGIIRQTISTFEGSCRNKKIAIELTLTGEILLVNADMSRIQQVLYNLIDNAIKFSHRNSVIKVETTERHHKIFVSVKDSGIGIPKDSINMVWDRFYKTDISRGKDKKGTGLGLSITREIIRAHAENINVISTEGVGTEFIFTLPISNHMADETEEEE